MKANVFLTFIGAALLLQVTEAAAIQNDEIDFGTAARILLKHIQHLMPCGLAPFHIPPLAPVHVEHYEFNTNSSDYKISGQVSNFFITGLENLETLALEYNTTTKRFFFDLLFPQIQLLGEYRIDDCSKFASFPARLVAEGLLNNKFVGYRLIGYFVLSPVNKSSGLRITDYDFKFLLENVAISNENKYWDNALNNFVNKFCAEGFLVWTQQIQKHLNDYIEQYLLQGANEILEKFSEKAILAKIIDLIVLLETLSCEPA